MMKKLGCSLPKFDGVVGTALTNTTEQRFMSGVISEERMSWALRM